MKTCLIYYRQSSTEQVIAGAGKEEDQRLCRDYAKRLGFEVVAEIADEISGATPLFDRPAGRQVVQAFEKKTVDAVIFPRQDRLAREQIPVTFPGLVILARRTGVELHFADTGQVPVENAWITHALGFGAVYAGEEKEKIRQRTTAGRRNHAAGTGGKTARPVLTGTPPLGYQKVGIGKEARLVIDPIGAEVVREVFRLYVSDGWSINGISRHLNSRLVPTSRGTGKWYPSTVRYLLRNGLYKGLWAYNKSTGSDGKEGRLPRTVQAPEDWITISVPELALVSADTFERAQKRLEAPVKSSPRGEYLLTGYIKCGLDGYAVIGSNRGVRSYRCGRHWEDKGHHCPNYTGGTNADKLEAAIWTWLEQQTSDQGALAARIQGHYRNEHARLAEHRQHLSRIEETIAEAEARGARLVRLLSDADDYIATKARQDLSLIGEEVKAAKAQRDKLAPERLALVEVLAIDPLAAEDLAGQVVERIRKISPERSGLTFRQKQAILDEVGFAGVLYPDRIEVSTNITPPSSLSQLSRK